VDVTLTDRLLGVWCRPGRSPSWQDGGMERVLGIGGYFLRSADPEALGAWYRDCLGLDADENGLWRQEAGPTVFATFESGTDYFGSRAQQTMLNFRVRDLGAMLAQLRAAGADVALAQLLPDRRGQLRGGIVGTPIRSAPDILAALTTEQLFQSLAVRINGPRAAGRRLLLRWEFTDTSENWTLLLSNGALTPMPGDPPRGEQPHVTLRLTRAILDAVFGRTTTFAEEIVAGRVLLAGDAQALADFGTFLDQPDPDFAIVTP
jgi:hypothetical protein